MRGGFLELAVARWRRWEALGVSMLVGIGVAAAWAPAASAAPANDDFAAAQDLGSALPVTTSGSNIGATSQPGEPHWVQAAVGHSIWFKWRAAESGPVTAETCGSEPVTVLGVYTGTSVAALTEISGNVIADGPSPYCDRAEATFYAITGTTYMISVDGEPDSAVGTEGAIELHLRRTPPPANDSFAAAQPLSLSGLEVRGENRGATKQPGEPLHRGDPGGASVWYSVTADQTGGILLDACEYRFHDDVAVYTGSSVSGLTAVPENVATESCEYSFDSVAGVTYFVAVDGRPGTQAGSVELGSFSVSARDVPGNDDFADAWNFGSFPDGTFTVFRLSNAGAGKEPGEPDHAGNPGGASVWFNWVPQQTGSAYVGTCESTMNTLIGVYTGSSLGSLHEVASQDLVDPPPCTLIGRPSLGFNVDAGTIYKIAIDGYGGSVGRFALQISASKERLPEPGPSPTAVTQPTPPKTLLAKRRLRLSRGWVEFVLRSDQPESTFRCRLDRRRVQQCPKRVVYAHLRPGRHVFRAFAVDAAGADRTPITVRFRVPS